jgi:hypothetical protein
MTVSADLMDGYVYIKKIEVQKGGVWSTVIEGNPVIEARVKAGEMIMIDAPVILPLGWYDSVRLTIDFKVRAFKVERRIEDFDFTLEQAPYQMSVNGWEVSVTDIIEFPPLSFEIVAGAETLLVFKTRSFINYSTETTYDGWNLSLSVRIVDDLVYD